MISANLLDDMRFALLFNGLGGHAQRVLYCQRRARAVSNDANSVHAEQRTAAVLFVVGLGLNRSNGIFREECASLSHRRAHELVLEPFKHRHRDRFARFEDHVANESVAHDNFNWIFKEMAAFYVADEVKRTWFEHLKHFLG